MNFKEAIISLEEEVDGLLACGRTPYTVSLKTSDLDALKSAMQEVLNNLKELPEEPPKEPLEEPTK